MVREAHNTNLYNNNPSSQYHDNLDRNLPYTNYAIESPQDSPLPRNSFRDKRDNKESMNNAESQPSQQLPPLPLTSQIQPSVTPDHQGEKSDLLSTFWDTFNNKQSMNNNASQPSKQPPSQPSQQLPPLSPTSQIQPSVTPDHQGEKADIFSSLWDTFDNKESMNNNASQPPKQPPSQPSQQLLPLPPTSQIQPSVTPDHQGEKSELLSTFWDTFNNKQSMNNNASQPSKQPPSQPSQQLPPLSPTSQIQPSVTPDHQGEKADIFSSLWDTFDNKESMNNNASQPPKQPPSQPSQQLLPLPSTSQIQPSVTPDHQREKADIFPFLWDTFHNKESMNSNASQPSKQPPSQPSKQLLPLPSTSQIQPSVTPDHQREKADIFPSLWDTFHNKESMNNNASQPSKQPPSQPSQQLLPLPSTSQIQPAVTPDHQRERADIFPFLWDAFHNKESMNSNASQPSQQLLPLSPTSEIQPSVTPDIFSSSQTQPSKNNGTKTSTNISDPSASSSSTAGFLISSGTIPPLVETTKPSSLTRPLTAATAKTSSPATLSTTSTSRPSQLPGDTANVGP
uniref:Uncharacterized protein n=1 Tax=Populus trichocarpa TaxID=3694 RepID=A0A2K1WSF6_POPTR